MSKAKRATARRGFGAIRRLPSGRFQASFVGPDTVRHTAPVTFETRADAEAWLVDRRREVADAGADWLPPVARKRSRPITFGEYAEAWISTRDIKATSRDLYRSLLNNHLLPTFAATPITGIDVDAVRRWHAALDTGPTSRANAYGLLRTIMGDAVDEGLITRSPVRIKGAGSKQRSRELRVLTIEELNAIAEGIPPRYKSLVLLGGWCGLRFGELAALRRSDLDLTNGLVRVRRAVTARRGEKFEGEPKAASSRVVTIPPHILPALRDHLREHAAWGRDGLVFPPRDPEGRFLALSTLHRVFDRAKLAAGRPDVRVHDLRHFGAIQAARAGATLGELQQRLGHRSASAALIYQSAVSERPGAIAEAMSRLAERGAAE